MNDTLREKSRRYSHMGMSSGCNFTYASQYQNAYEILYESDTAVDRIALPMLYSMRHYLELVLKYNVEYFHEFSGSKAMVGKSVHTLTKLSVAFDEHWGLVKQRFNITVDDKGLISDFSKLIEELDEIDNFAISFRYSHDREKNKNFEWSDTIDIHALNKLFESSKILLNHSIDLFDDTTGLMHGTVTKEEVLRSIATPVG